MGYLLMYIEKQGEVKVLSSITTGSLASTFKKRVGGVDTISTHLRENS
jgi:hypothetical protein